MDSNKDKFDLGNHPENHNSNNETINKFKDEEA